MLLVDAHLEAVLYDYVLSTSLTCLKETYDGTSHSGVEIDTVEAANFPALPAVVFLFLVGPLQFIVGFTTCILVLAGRGRTGVLLLFSALGILSSIVVL